MAFRTPTVNLLDGKRTYCRLCQKDLVLRDAEFKMKQIRSGKTISIKEQLYFCQSCHRYYITQQMSHDLVQKHPGYYVDVSLYDIKTPKKAIRQKASTENGKQNSEIRNKVQSINIDHKTSQEPPASTTSKKPATLSKLSNNSVLTAPIYMFNTFAAVHNICPFCNSVLGKEAVNIPIINADGNFFRYYIEVASYCYKCRRAFVTQKEADGLLKKINGTDGSKLTRTVRFENVSVQRGQNSQEYLYRPTLDNSYALFVSGHDYQRNQPSTSGSIDLNPQSFLGKMGYSVNKEVNERHKILIAAIRIYGKRKVTDHLAFLISTRKGQDNGSKKYAHAISIWHEDLNFISKL